MRGSATICSDARVSEPLISKFKRSLNNLLKLSAYLLKLSAHCQSCVNWHLFEVQRALPPRGNNLKGIADKVCTLKAKS